MTIHKNTKTDVKPETEMMKPEMRLRTETEIRQEMDLRRITMTTSMNIQLRFR